MSTTPPGLIQVDKVYYGDFGQLHHDIPDNCIDLVFTDPPYPKEFFYTYEYLAQFCPRVMKHGASLMTIAAHYSLEQIMLAFHGQLKFRWICDMDQSEGAHARMAMGIEVMHKPILWYVKGSYPSGRGFLRDVIKITGKDGQKKTHGHKWEQDISWAMYYIEKLCPPGGTVLDPYMGTGTVAEACIRLGDRHYIGYEIAAAYWEICQERIEIANRERRLNGEG